MSLPFTAHLCIRYKLFFLFQEYKLPEAITWEPGVRLTNRLKRRKAREVLYHLVTNFAGYGHFSGRFRASKVPKIQFKHFIAPLQDENFNIFKTSCDLVTKLYRNAYLANQKLQGDFRTILCSNENLL